MMKIRLFTYKPVILHRTFRAVRKTSPGIVLGSRICLLDVICTWLERLDQIVCLHRDGARLWSVEK